MTTKGANHIKKCHPTSGLDFFSWTFEFLNMNFSSVWGPFSDGETYAFFGGLQSFLLILPPQSIPMRREHFCVNQQPKHTQTFACHPILFLYTLPGYRIRLRASHAQLPHITTYISNITCVCLDRWGRMTPSMRMHRHLSPVLNFFRNLPTPLCADPTPATDASV